MNHPTPMQSLHRWMLGRVNTPIHPRLQTRRFGRCLISSAWAWLTLCALTALAMPVRAATSLITNGSFETSTAVGSVTLPPGTAALAGWTIVAKVYITAPGTTFWPGNSTRWISLVDQQGNGSMEQSFATTSGKTYQASMRTFNGSDKYSGGKPTPNALTVSATGNSALTVMNTPGQEKTVTYEFTAIGATSTLRIADASGYASNAGWIDEVTVEEVDITKPAASVTLGSLSGFFDGSPKPATATTVPAGLMVIITYNGSTTVPIDVGSYAVVATVIDASYAGSASGALNISEPLPSIITNGHFETSTAVGQVTLDPGSTALAGWTILAKVNITARGNIFWPNNSSRWISLCDWHGYGSIEQSFATTLGKTYQASMRTFNGGLVYSEPPGLTSTAFTVSTTGNNPLTVMNPPGQEKTVTYQFTATGATTTLRIADVSGYASNASWIDDVKVEEIAPAATPPVITSADSASGIFGVSFSYQITATSSPTSYGATGLPAGLLVNTSSGLISGTVANAGTYPFTVSATNAGGTGTRTVTLSIAKAAATVTLANLTPTYDGTAKSATATTGPAGLTVNFTYDGSATAPTAAGSYAAVGTVNDANYTGSASGTLTIAKATAIVTLGNLSHTYDGTIKSASATTVPAGLNVNITYDPSTAPTAAGSYATVGTVNDANYTGSASGTLTIAKATAIVTLGNLSHTYDGTAKSASATTVPAGLNVNITYDPSTAPTAAGSYAAVGTVNDANYTGSASGTLTIAKATAIVTLGNLSHTYDGTAKSASATTGPAGLNVNITYDPSTAPTAAGSYAAVGAVNDANYTGSASGTLAIAKAAAIVTLGNLSHTYDGTAKSASATTVPAGLMVIITYNGSTTVPTAVGSYAVVATVNDASYAGSVSGTLNISEPLPSTIITNGNFETSTAVGSVTLPPGTAALAGWTILAKVLITAPGTTFWPGNSTRWISLVDQQGNGSMEQSFATTPGKIYKASMRTFNGGLVYSAAPGPTSRAFTVSATGNSALTVTNAPGQEKTVTYQFTAVGATSTLRIADASGYASNAGWIDDVMVKEAEAASVTLGSLAQTYNGTPKPATATTVPANLTVNFTYDGSASPPTAAGSYAVVATVNDANYAGSASGTLTIAQASATVTLGGLAQTYDSTPKPATATTAPAGLSVSFKYNGSTTQPINAGSYAVVATVNDANYAGSASGTLTIAQAPATVTLHLLAQSYDETPKPVFATTVPADLTVNFTYDGSASPPTAPGSYAVVATVNDANHVGSASGTLTIVNYRLPGGAVSRWTGNFNANDSVGFSDGTMQAGATFTNGEVGQAFSFDGVNDYVRVQMPFGSFGEQITVEYWINLTSVKPGTFLSQGTAGLNATVWMMRLEPNGSLIWGVNRSGGAGTSVPIPTPLTLGAWHHIAGVADEVSTRIYLDGALVGSTEGSRSRILYNPGSVIQLGKDIRTPSFMKGALDEVTIYNRALTGSEIQSISDAGAAGKIPLTANLTLGSLFQMYDGNPKPVTATTVPANLAVNLTYDGSPVPPAAVGSYTVEATVNDVNYSRSARDELTIGKAPASVTLGSLAHTYDGTAKSASVTTVPPGLGVRVTYNGSAIPPIHGGSYTVVATIDNSNYTGSASGTLIIAPAAATVALASLAQIYDGTAKSASATTVPPGVSCGFTYNGSATRPTNAGSYTVVATINDPSFTGPPASGKLTIAKAVATVTLGNLSHTYDGTAKSASVTTAPAGLSNLVAYFFGTRWVNPTNVVLLVNPGYGVYAQIIHSNYTGSASGMLSIKATVPVKLGSLAHYYDGTTKSATATTVPPGLAVNFTYNGMTELPTNPGSYSVVGSVNEATYTGSASGTLEIRNPFPTGVAWWGRGSLGWSLDIERLVSVEPPVYEYSARAVAVSQATAIAAGSESHSAALRSDGTVYTWDTRGPINVPARGATGVKAIAAGYFHTVALKTNETVVAWGRDVLNNWGEVLDTDWGQTSVPPGLTNVTAIAAGRDFTMALKSDGTVVTWGGQFEDYIELDIWLPRTRVPTGLGVVKAIAAGGLHAVALKSDGTVVAWGDNGAGQTNVPPGLTNVTAITAGANFTVALKSDGTVVAWGDDHLGKTNVPPGLTNVTAIAAGNNFTVALKSDGTVVDWGSGASPVTEGLTGVTAIAAGPGSNHMMALVRYPILNPIVPAEHEGGTGSFTLSLSGSGFAASSKVLWSTNSLTNTFMSDSAMSATVSSNLAPVPTEGIKTVQIRVVNLSGLSSLSQPFTVKGTNVGPVQNKVAAAGQSVLVQTPPQAGPPSLPGLTANFVNKSGSAASVTTAAYTSNPKSGMVIQIGGQYVDLQISGADTNDSATVQFYYPSTITGTNEASLVLRVPVYYKGKWIWPQVLSSGSSSPVKNMMDNLEGTVSGGRFTVLFDNTSFPKITQLSGTVFAMLINEAPVAQPDAATVAAGAVLAIGAPGVLGNDTDPEDDPLDAVLVSEASHGQVTLQPDGSFTYTPEANYTGPDSFSYLAYDGNADSEIVTVAITVTPANTPPIIVNLTGAYGAAFSYTIPANAFGDAGTSPTFSLAASGLPPGIALDAAARTLSGTPRAAGVFLAQVAASDNAALPPWNATASFTFTVTRAPLIVTANHAARNYDQADPPFSGHILGVLNNDAISATYSTSATESSPVGTYPIIPDLLDLQNKLGHYIVTRINGTLTVLNVPPVVDAGPDQEKVALDEVTFIGVFSDPSSPSHAIGWDFGDGSPAVTGTLTPTHTYAKHGTYTVTLIVTDSHQASASDTLTVTVISALGCATEARDGLQPFVNESQRLAKAVKDLTASLEPKPWVDEMHLDPKGGRKAFVYWRQATDMLEQVLKPSQKRERDDDEEDDDEEFKKLIGDKKSDNLSAAAMQAIRQALADVICASRLISETVYLESEGLPALDPKRQKQVDAELARATEDLDQANALAEQGEFGKAVRRYISSWNNTQEAIEIAGRSQPAKELVKALGLIEESLDPKYWADEPLFLHLDLKIGRKTFDLMQSAARELANVVQDAAKGRVLATVGQQAADELADLLEKARLVSRTLYAENANLKAVNPKNQKAVDADLKRAKEDLDKGAAAETAKDFDKALSDYANAWDDTVRAIEEAAKK